MCTSLVLSNSPLIVTFYTLMYIRTANVRRKDTILCCVGLRIKKRWFVCTIPAWERSPFEKEIEEVRKNRSFIWFMIWFVETGVFPKVTLLLYMRGHKNNATDRLFNLLKGGYHNKNIYKLQDMVEVLNYHEQVELITMKIYHFLTIISSSKII